jgi:hypothetical protein
MQTDGLPTQSHCQYSYPTFIPFSPRTPVQVAVRANSSAVSTHWRALTENQRAIWCAFARIKQYQPSLYQNGPKVEW